jgi:hypothetical protein
MVSTVYPVTLLVIALTTGAAVGLKDSAAQAVREAYSTLVAAVRRKYPSVDLEPVTRSPGSAEARRSLTQALSAADPEPGHDVLETARALILRVEQQDPDAVAAIGVDIERVKAAFIDIAGVAGGSSGVRVRDAEVSGGITVKDVRAGSGPVPNR